MYISKVKIQNYRNFSNFDLELKTFTSIIGENNTGKTNLLNSLGLIFSNEIIFFKKRMLEIDDINHKAISEFKEKIVDETVPVSEIEFPEVKVEVILENFDENQEAIVSDWFIDKDLTKAKLTYLFTNKNQKKLNWIEEQRNLVKQLHKLKNDDDTCFRQRKIANVNFPIKDYSYSIHGGHDDTKQVEWYFLKMLRMEYLDALRDAKKELVASGDSRLLHKILINRDENRFQELKDGLNSLHAIIQKNDELSLIKDEIGRYLDTVSLQDNFVDNSVDFQFSSIETIELLKKLSLIYGNEPVNVERNGMGRNNLLFISLILSHLSSKSSVIDNVYYRLICVEEPEAHLHPHLQKHLGNSLQQNVNKENQIIITSHSTHIASKLDLNNTVVFYKDTDGNIKNHYILSNFGTTAKDKKTIRYLMKYLDATNSNLFFSRRVILVEGISEQLLIPVFFEMKYGTTLDKVRCNIVNVNGVAFRNFLEIAKNGYFVKFVVLTDSDKGTEAEDRADTLQNDYSTFDNITIKSTDEITFEIEILKNNSTGFGGMILLQALILTRPRAGKEYIERLGKPELNIDEFFKLIKEYKSEFAFNLVELLQKRQITKFNIPDYIVQAFEFLKD